MAKTEEKKKTKVDKSVAREVSPAVFREKAFEAILKNVDEDEVVRVEALIKGHSTPDKITFGGYNAKSFQPDALAVFNDRKDVYAIEAESNKKAIAKNLGKWILFSLHAKKNRGRFIIVTSKAHEEAIQGVINSKQINASVLILDKSAKK